MGKLNQVIAVVASKKAIATQSLTEAYHRIQKPELFAGIARTYQPREEEGEKLPPETKGVQTKVKDLIAGVRTALVEMFDIIATQDFANCEAFADVTVDGKLILHQIPVTHLLFLEKQVKDLETFVGKLPTLDPSEDWHFEDNVDCYGTRPSETTRTKKVERPFVLYEATKEHPAQVKVATEDVLVGYWKTIKFSGAIPAKDKNAMLERVRKLHQGIVRAREEANSMDVSERHTGDQIFTFVFEGGAQS